MLPMRKLGKSGVELTEIGFGAWAVGGPWRFGWGAQDDEDDIADNGAENSQKIYPVPLLPWIDKNTIEFLFGNQIEDNGEYGEDAKRQADERPLDSLFSRGGGFYSEKDEDQQAQQKRIEDIGNYPGQFLSHRHDGTRHFTT